jgi:hypothetical protein
LPDLAGTPLRQNSPQVFFEVMAYAFELENDFRRQPHHNPDVGGAQMLTRAEVLAMTKRVARRLAANETGVAPANAKHLRRFTQLKRQQDKKPKGSGAAAANRRG